MRFYIFLLAVIVNSACLYTLGSGMSWQYLACSILLVFCTVLGMEEGWHEAQKPLPSADDAAKKSQMLQRKGVW